MAGLPTCLVAVDGGAFGSTLNGIDVDGDAAINIKLASFIDVSRWYLRVSGTDEQTSSPDLVGTNSAHLVVGGPTAIVSMVYPSENIPPGRAVIIESTVVGPSGTATATFGLYLPTILGNRVGAVNENREGSVNFGWATKVNPVLRTAGSSIQGVTVDCDPDVELRDPVNMSTGIAVKADASALLRVDGFVYSKPSPTQATIINSGALGVPGLTSGATYFLGNTPGSMTPFWDTPSDMCQKLGVAVSSTKLLILLGDAVLA